MTLTKNRLTGIVSLILGGLYLYATSCLVVPPVADPIGPKAFPYLVSFGLLCVGLLLVLKREKPSEKNRAVIFDLKTTTDWTFDHHQTETPRPYEWQQQVYMWGRQRRNAVLLYINLKGDFAETWLTFDREKVLTALRHARSVLDDVLSKESGKREYHMDKFPCTYCQHRAPCWMLTAQDLAKDRVVIENRRQLGKVTLPVLQALEINRRAADISGKEFAEADRRAREAGLRLLESFNTREFVVPGSVRVRRYGKGIRIEDY